MTATSWMAIVPIRRLSEAKSRLAVPNREGYAIAFLKDVLGVLLSSNEIRSVVVTTPDPAVQRHAFGCAVVLEPGTGIDSAIECARNWGRDVGHHGPVLAVLPDLPALQVSEIDRMLQEARKHDRSFHPDSQGDGTTCVTARRAIDLRTKFGPGSANRHRNSSITELGGFGRGLSCDVDTIEDLCKAASLGVGHHTMSLLSGVHGFDPASPR
ncbi:2-phospho-L-lactate guanylyltransferase [Rhodococcus fascians]|uniref:2-phospho-L-lactate guanylyltransferase n=1 Tax=Rhodococcoides fascians TaxID=1828 RepID=UPI001427DBED|nr:2-phospho-L-lactate guanylyltransferase [Rhodococcus fascians]